MGNQVLRPERPCHAQVGLQPRPEGRRGLRGELLADDVHHQGVEGLAADGAERAGAQPVDQPGQACVDRGQMGLGQEGRGRVAGR
jgi:hypothetical protein